MIDETSFAKRGEKTVGVQRQYCGPTGKVHNCIVSAALGYASLRGEFRCTLGHQFILPQSRDADKPRRREAGLPDDPRSCSFQLLLVLACAVQADHQADRKDDLRELPEWEDADQSSREDDAEPANTLKAHDFRYRVSE